MGERDVWARMTPYEVGIPGREFAEANFPAIRREAEARKVDDTDPGAFLLLGEVGRTLKEIQGEERGGEALHQFGAFLFHAYHFHGAGEPLLLVETEALREAIHHEGSPDGGDARLWEGELPAHAGYLQLPRHLVWSHPDPEGPAEDVDGVFWTRSSGGSLSLLAALGIRGDRPGLSVVPLPPVPLADAPRWPAAPVRAEGEGPDFATTLPGGELDGLYSVIRAGEVLKLVARVMAHVHAHPGVLGATERAPHPRDAGATATGRMAGARPSLLPYRRIGSRQVG
ncbi:MAG: hypothetical protein EA422_10310 [Gemmatimonadales bacterium]|nr:MAG: hypothetical protein EA422_10310 [Gemmatimonadales bacterium]